MIDLSVLPLFLTTIFFLAISPGPDLVLISSYSSTKGFMAGVMISLGVLVAGLLQTCLVALGLASLMMTMPSIAFAIKLIGALYLSYLGGKMLLAWYKGLSQADLHQAMPMNSEANPNDIKLSAIHLVNKGLLNNLLNPKALLFFSLLLPQFTTPNSELSSQILLLGCILSVLVFGVNLLVSFSFSRLGKLVGNKLTLTQHIDGLLGAIFLGLAARLLSTK